LSARYKETGDLMCFLKRLGLAEFPIFQDNSGLSYIAARLYLEDADVEIFEYMANITKNPHMLRYSDDLYILFNSNHQLGNMGHNIQSQIKSDISNILTTYDLELNEKFSIEETAMLPQNVYT